MKRALFAMLLLLGCRDKNAAKPEPVDAAPSASVAVPASPPPSARPSAVAEPDPPPVHVLEPDKDAEISPAAAKRVEAWKKREIKVRWTYQELGQPTDEAFKTEYARYGGVFEVISATVMNPVMAGGRDPSYEMLIVTKSGEVERVTSDVIGLVDLNGDGRRDLVLKSVTAIADMPNGPLVLKIGDKGGAYGWRECTITTYEGKPALAAVTQTDTSTEIGAIRVGGYMEQRTQGIREEVLLQWDGKKLAAVSRKPLETAAEADARKKKYDAENAVEEARVAPARKDCTDRCVNSDCDGGAACAKRCKDRCDAFWN